MINSSYGSLTESFFNFFSSFPFYNSDSVPHLLGQIIIDDQGMLAVVSEVLSHGAARVWGQVLQRSGIRGRGRDHNGVLHGTGVGEPLHQLGDSGPLLADGNVDAVQLLLLVSSFVEALLVDDRVDGDGSFAGE